MGIPIQIHVDGKTVTPNQTTRGINQERIGRSGLIEVNGRKKLPRRCKIRMRNDGPTIKLRVLKPELADSSDEFG